MRLPTQSSFLPSNTNGKRPFGPITVLVFGLGTFFIHTGMIEIFVRVAMAMGMVMTMVVMAMVVMRRGMSGLIFKTATRAIRHIGWRRKKRSEKNSGGKIRSGGVRKQRC
jgi:hypothetical protein